MAKINILGPEIYTRIAAGEVIDGPYSAVKELIENSLDAGATDIEIHIEKAGKQLIRVADNGCGIEREDLRAVFIPHATSKIGKVTDLDYIKTLGFRGEALPSIASISQCEIVSVVEGKQAFKVYCEGTEIMREQPAVLEKGTQISVNNLFYNTPVRAKFLRSDKKEEAEITNYVTRYILGNPEVSFRYYVDGKLKLQSYGGGLDEAVAQIYGASVISQCFKINAEKNTIRVRGFIGNQNFFKPNKTYQHVFLNGRNIVNNCISTAISTAYQSYAMKRQYPFYVLFIDIPKHTVDVNVHPNKSDVRFVDNQAVFGTIYKILTSILDGTAKAADFVVDSLRIPEIKSTSPESESKNVVYGGNLSIDNSEFNKLYDKVNYVPEYKENKKIKLEDLTDDKDEQCEANISPFDEYRFPQQIREIDNDYEPLFPASENLSVFSPFGIFGETTICDLQRSNEQRIQERIIYKSCKYKCSLFNTYLVYEMENAIYIIDQHAAHERLIYDTLIEQSHKKGVVRQLMLIPYIKAFSDPEYMFLKENMDIIDRMGYTLEPFCERAFKVTEVPVGMERVNLNGFFDEILVDLESLKKLNVEDIMRERLALASCKRAVKGGHELTHEESDKLFEMLKGNMGLKCPHGRPVCVRLTKNQMEKMFKRIM